jgi:potassium-transporting ATPase KdpC subunit
MATEILDDKSNGDPAAAGTSGDEAQTGDERLSRGPRWMSYARPSLVLLVILLVLTGVVYPLFILGIGQAAFQQKANGNLIVANGRVAGSALIGQPFTDARYFWSRPSATSPYAYAGAASGGSNLGPTNPVLLNALADRIAALHAADPGNTAPVPIDLVTASASGLDPDISPAAAQYQAARVARARGLSSAAVESLVAKYTSGRQLGFLGEPRVNVLRLNLALDALGQ